MTFTKIYKKNKVSPTDIRKLFSSSYQPSKYQMKDITIDGRLYCQFNTSFIYVPHHSFLHFQSFIDQGDSE